MGAQVGLTVGLQGESSAAIKMVSGIPEKESPSIQFCCLSKENGDVTRKFRGEIIGVFPEAAFVLQSV